MRAYALHIHTLLQRFIGFVLFFILLFFLTWCCRKARQSPPVHSDAIKTNNKASEHNKWKNKKNKRPNNEVATANFQLPQHQQASRRDRYLKRISQNRMNCVCFCGFVARKARKGANAVFALKLENRRTAAYAEQSVNNGTIS